ncbi:restriction endonuclease subunit S [Fusobacterium pseudoperiodonticum]|uniref:restriction endonuclease subunit S n=1 Tax=Fusobacterium pseudoperiodonticum TaxID=2663009 RepID=UPI000C1B0254|nr:restriction endonuclease subunit S [Fusobacterium pseudoperiodonticum]PIM77928.1 hypothetical protein CTM69_00045 [Fusobacterium pseudoperiodonticum]
MIKNIQYKKLGEICDFISGGTPSKSKNEYWKNGNIPWIKISDFKEKYIKCSDEKITKNGLENSSAKLLKKGTILYTIFASVGKVAILDIEATTNQAIVGVNLKENNLVDKDFLYYFLCSIENNIKRQARGVAQNNINISILKNVCIPILPISSQKNIVKTLMRLEDILENFKQKQILINFLNKSLFTKYSIGEKESIANLCYVKARIGWQGLTKKEYLSNGEYYLITGVDFKNEKIDFKNCFYVTKERYNQDENIKVKINDILLTKDGTIGKVAIVDKLEKPATLNSGVFVLRPKVNNLNVTYLMHSLISEDFKKFIDDIKIGATVPHLNQAALLKYKLILPPIELQNKFAKKIEKITKLSFEIEEAIKEAENLYNSLISKYFD